MNELGLKTDQDGPEEILPGSSSWGKVFLRDCSWKMFHPSPSEENSEVPVERSFSRVSEKSDAVILPPRKTYWDPPSSVLSGTVPQNPLLDRVQPGEGRGACFW